MGTTLNVLSGVVIGGLASQFPEYSTQYVQRLGGAVDALQTVVEDFDTSAEAVGLTRDAALDSMTGNVFQIRRQEDMRRTIARHASLAASYEQLKEADAMTRLRHIGSFSDTEVASRAWEDFKPAVPLTPDSLGFSGGGFLSGFLALFGLGWIGRRMRRRSNGEASKA